MKQQNNLPHQFNNNNMGFMNLNGIDGNGGNMGVNLNNLSNIGALGNLAAMGNLQSVNPNLLNSILYLR